jgi:hypothetical protein
MKVDKQLILIVLASFCVLVLGSIGFYRQSPNSEFSTALYKSIQLFSMESGVLDQPPTPLLVEVARWLALCTLAGVVFTALQALLGHFRTTVRIAFANNHVIICGAGRRGEALARAFHKAGKEKIVVIELNEQNSTLGELKNLGVEILIGNALDSGLLQKAGISKARSLIAVTGNDEKNLLICSEVEEKLNSSCDLSAGVESWAWRSYYLDRLHSKIRLDSFLCRATRNLMMEFGCEAAKDADLRQKGVRILIEATGSTRQELIRAAVIMLQISGDQRPVVVLTSVSPSDEEAFLERYPATDLAVHIIWHRQTASQVFEERCADVPDFAIFALPTDEETLEAAERFWMRHQMIDARVLACLQGDSDAVNMKSLSKKKRDFAIKSLLEYGLGSKDPLEPDIEQRAKICHAIYFKNEKAKNPSYGTNPTDIAEDWYGLAERLRESNRLAAMHNEIKRHAWQTKNDSTSLEMLVHLSRCEHMRWMAEKAMDGWRWSGSGDKLTRDNDKLKHHLLVPYDSLESPEKDKDYNAFLWALDIPDEKLNSLNLSEESKRMVKFAKEIKK